RVITQCFTKLVCVNNHGSNAKIIEPLLRRLRYDTGAMIAMSRLYGERYLALIDDITHNPARAPPTIETPADEAPGWPSSELETSPGLAHDESMVRMARAVAQVPERPA